MVVPPGTPSRESASEAAGAPARALITSSEHGEGSRVTCERSGPIVTNNGGKQSPRLSNFVDTAEARRGVDEGGRKYVTPSEAVFSGELAGIKAPSSKSVACSARSGGLADEAHPAAARVEDGEEDELHLDVTADIGNADVEELLFFIVSVESFD